MTVSIDDLFHDRMHSKSKSNQSCRQLLGFSADISDVGLDAFENLSGSLLDVVHRLDQHLRVAVVELDIVGAVVERIESKSLTDNMRNGFMSVRYS